MRWTSQLRGPGLAPAGVASAASSHDRRPRSRSAGGGIRSFVSARHCRARAETERRLAVLDARAKRRELSNLGVEAAAESPLFARIAELVSDPAVLRGVAQLVEIGERGGVSVTVTKSVGLPQCDVVVKAVATHCSLECREDSLRVFVGAVHV